NTPRGLAQMSMVYDPHAARGDEERGCHRDVDRGEVGGEQLYERSAAGDGVRDPTVMADVVRGVQFIDDMHVPLDPDLLPPAQSDRFVLFGGHGFSLLLR